jgi:hypothetical protein
LTVIWAVAPSPTATAADTHGGEWERCARDLGREPSTHAKRDAYGGPQRRRHTLDVALSFSPTGIRSQKATSASVAHALSAPCISD